MFVYDSTPLQMRVSFFYYIPLLVGPILKNGPIILSRWRRGGGAEMHASPSPSPSATTTTATDAGWPREAGRCSGVCLAFAGRFQSPSRTCYYCFDRLMTGDPYNFPPAVIILLGALHACCSLVVSFEHLSSDHLCSVQSNRKQVI